MTEQYIFYSVCFYVLGLFLSAAFALREKKFTFASWLFVIANGIGISTGAVYFSSMGGQSVEFAKLNWFFDFAPRLTMLSAIFFTVIAVVSSLVGVYSIRYLDLYKNEYSPSRTLALIAIFVLGMQGVLFANNAFSFLFFWEVMSITSFFLVLADKSQESVKAAFLYFIMTHLGASAILGGFLVLGGGMLTFDFQNIAALSEKLSPMMVALSFSLFFFGFGSKAGLVPVHVWLPEAHPQAPSNVSALMSGLMLKVAVYGFIMVLFNFATLPAWATLLIIALGLLSGIVGALYAVIEKDMKRAFAFSSIENVGIIFTMLGLSLYLNHYANVSSEVVFIANAILVFAIFHAISHALFKTALFLSSGVVISRVHTKNMDHMGGIAKIMPLFSFAFLIAILASLPLPPFATFFGEWGMIQNIISLMHDASMTSGIVTVMVLVLSSIGLIGGLAVFAMVKVFGISMLGLPRSSHVEKRNEKEDYFLMVPVLLLAAGVVLLGIFAKSILGYLMENVQSLVGLSTHAQSLQISSLAMFAAILFFFIMAIAMKKIIVKKQTEREYHTWDCGQPINSTMEYTATAFSAPIRFFFLKFIRRVNVLKSEPIIATNPWLRTFTFSLSINSVWREKIYGNLASLFIVGAKKLKVIQSGRIQYYLLFLLFTLIITLMIAL